MNRRSFIASITALFAVKVAPAQKPTQKWYITGGNRATQTDCDVEPIITYGATFIDALVHSGITMWTAEEYEKLEPLSCIRYAPKPKGQPWTP